MMMMLYENFDPFKYYGANEYLTSFGLSVSRKYKGRSIGDRFLARDKFQVVTHTFFTSDFSNHNADKAGSEMNVSIK